MTHSLPSLPFGYDALEPYIDAQTMHIHHEKHHQAYIDKLNAALANHKDLREIPVDELLKNLARVPVEIKTAVRNHGGGHSNHSIFWTLLSPKKQDATEEVKAQITHHFEKWDTFVEKFNTTAAGQFGSGWAWLIKKPDGTLVVQGYANQDSPYLDGDTPILGIDVWEHAYYLKYQNRRPDYISAFWNIINWKEVGKRLAL